MRSIGRPALRIRSVSHGARNAAHGIQNVRRAAEPRAGRSEPSLVGVQGAAVDDFASSVLGLAFVLKLPSARLDVGTPLLSPEDGGLPFSRGIEKPQNTKGDNINRNRNGYGHFASFVQSLNRYSSSSSANLQRAESNRGLKSAEWGNPPFPLRRLMPARFTPGVGPVGRLLPTSVNSHAGLSPAKAHAGAPPSRSRTPRVSKRSAALIARAAGGSEGAKRRTSFIRRGAALVPNV